MDEFPGRQAAVLSFSSAGANPQTVLSPGRMFHRSELRSMSLDGLLTPVFADAYTVTGTASTPAMRSHAVSLALPANLVNRAVLGRLTAAWIYGCGPAPSTISLLVDNGHRITALRPWSGCILHEVSLGPFDVIQFSGAAVTSPLRTAVDVALHVPSAQAVPVLLMLSADPVLKCPLTLIRDALESGCRIPHKTRALECVRWLLNHSGRL
ncbi:hypothetical protein IV498_05990 [Paenarthrobacter sp. Z7-10]|uniref:hypothetical protein n=1 Tax=Paenarthrobacter sp. Z7-10 TaxID=2787635 RepID=UPI0022A8E583|nr:hypothetical protein [Paenarthrobacter sp. Z7-10]MCZ2402747.1 hypothetical protein [Paenarthrobacter sp. Z7-10]